MLEKYPDNVRVVVKMFPLSSHKFSRQAATAALAADKQGKFPEFHALLFKNFRSLNEEKLKEIATELNLDLIKFEADRKSPEIAALISRDLNNGRTADVRGTPTVFLNGKRVKNRGMQSLQQMIEAEIRKAHQ
ncbi:MAG: thioredoxin domain-containing protein [Deltaproteobacteria bacterium]|nr:thioredoxin domain-containing protein [Deltaproteobacteria bacterium]